MGQIALGSLCTWTLETLQADPPVTRPVPSVRHAQNSLATAVSESDAARKERKFKLKSPFKKKIKNSATNNGLTVVVPQTNVDDEHRDGSDDHERMYQGTDAEMRQNSSPVRLQMFGSEYARYLSASALAPKSRSSRSLHTTASSRYGPFSLRQHRGAGKSGISTGIQQIMSTSSFGGHIRSTKNKIFAGTSWNLEDQDNAILTGAIVDICITNGEDTPPPKGYYRISQTVDGEEFHALKATGGAVSPKWKSSTYINVKKEPNWHRAAQRPCVTAITVIFPDRQEFVPPGFCVVREHCRSPSFTQRKGTSNGQATLNTNGHKEERETSIKDQPANFNTHGERVFVCFRRSREGNPITGILPLQPELNEAIPASYTVLERTPRNFVASVNPKKGSPVFLAYRQRLANLEPLRPLPLLLSVPPASEDPIPPSNMSSRSTENAPPKLSAYYCTGGTVVESEVGRYHIMDRSTHDLLSPSSVANRLSLIEISRRKAMPQLAGEYDDFPCHAKNDFEMGRSSFGCMASLDADTSFGANSSMADYPGNVNLSFGSRDSNSSFDGKDSVGAVMSTFHYSQVQAEGHYPKLYDSELQVNHDALNFIPVVETATHPAELQPQQHLRARTALLTPILSACYQRHGGAALKAVEGLTKLLSESDFFADDLDGSSHCASTRLTLLDLAVQVVCDVATGGTQETMFGACVEFVEGAMNYTIGHLNVRTIGYVLRFYLFVFYFGASTPTNSRFPSWTMPRIGFAEYHEAMQLLYDPRNGPKSMYLLGGAPQLAALSFKELVTLSISRLQRVCLSISPVHEEYVVNGEGVDLEADKGFIGDILSSIVDGAVSRIEVANFTQMAAHQIHRSGGSELFWHDMTTSCGVGLFGKEKSISQEARNMFVVTFSILANLVKVASGKIRTNNQTSELRPRDVASKLLSLELLLHFLERYRDEQGELVIIEHRNKQGLVRCVEKIIFSIRRLVVPCLFANTRAGLEDPAIFQRILRIVTCLWQTPLYRERMKGELGMLIEHFALRLLQLGPQLQQSRVAKSDFAHSDSLLCPLFRQQYDLLVEIKRWFSADPKAAAELYLNFDTDITSQTQEPMPLLPGTQWKVFQRSCAVLCNLAEKCGDLIGEQIRQSQTNKNSTKSSMTKMLGFSDITFEAPPENNAIKEPDMASVREGARLLRRAALDTIVQILKCLARTAAVTSGKNCYSLVSSWSECADDDFLGESLIGGNQNNCGPGSVLNFWRKEMASYRKTQPHAYSFEPQSSLLNSVTRDTAFEIARKKSVKKAVEYLIACNALSSSPRDIAAFLRLNKSDLDKAALGLYLGEDGLDGQETDYWNMIRFTYVRAISFDGMKVEEALRHFLSHCGFQLPGEAQKIDRIMSTFAQCYWEDNVGDVKNCPFRDQDTVFLLSFAIIMLNTDLHKSNTSAKTSRGKKKSGHKCITKAQFIKNLSGVEGLEEMKHDYLSALYDSIESNPIILADDEGIGAQNQSGPMESRNRMLKSMLHNVRSTDALLRSLSVHDVKWASIQDFSSSLEYEGAEALSDLTQSCISEAWHQFHGVVNTALETAHLDPEGMEPCVELLKYALVVTICLDMPVERAAFLSQLGRFKVFEDDENINEHGSFWVPDEEQGRQLLLQGNPAFDRAIAGPLDDDDKVKALVQVHKATEDLRSALHVDIAVKQEMTRVTRQLVDGEFLLNDPGRSFVRMGDLRKKSNKSGRMTEYRFMLFSDALIYAKEVTPSPGTTTGINTGSGSFVENVVEEQQCYKIHEELPLHLMKVVDWFPPSSNKDLMKLAFQVHHPRKTFLVFCSSAEERKEWVGDIRNAITREIQHKLKMEAARVAANALHAPPVM